MKFNKLLALVLVLAMVLSMAACTETPADPSGSSTPGTSTPATDPKPTDPADPDPVITDENVSIDFEDGNMGFVALYEGRANSDASTLEVVEKYGNKALKVTNGSGKVPYVAFDVWSLLGENAANVASVEMTLGIENPDGKFYACSGNLILWTIDKLSSTNYGWSVYLENKNPKTAVFTLEDYEAFSAENPVAVLTLETDNGATAGAANAHLYIFNISFKDASGNVLTADSTATFTNPTGFNDDKDMSNLKHLKNTVSLDGMAGISEIEWKQNGIEMTEEFIAALVPGAVIEIEYTTVAENGELWIVLPWSTAGWKRINAENGVTPSYNNSRNIMQVTYEQIVSVCGENVADWGALLQCESGGAWTVYSVKVGQDSGLVTTTDKTPIDGSFGAGAWTQDGPTLTEEQIALLQPGAIIEVAYSTASPTGDLWIVMPDDGVWSRVEQFTAACNGSTMQITYEQIAAVCGDDVSKWFQTGTRIQFESDGEWEVYSVSIGVSDGTASDPGTDDPGTDDPGVDIPVPEIPAVPEGATELYSGTTALSGWQNVCQVNTTVWGGTVDPATFTEGGTFSIYFTGKDVFSVHLIFNGATWAQADCELANATDLGDGTYVATFSVEDMMAVYGTDLSTVGAVHICSNSDAAGYAIVTLLTYTPAA